MLKITSSRVSWNDNTIVKMMGKKKTIVKMMRETETKRDYSV